MNYRLVIAGIILIAAVIFGFWFWGQVSHNQQELANMPMQTEEADNDSR